MRYQLLTDQRRDGTHLRGAELETPPRTLVTKQDETREEQEPRARLSVSLWTASEDHADPARCAGGLGFNAYPTSPRKVRTAPNRFTRLSLVTNDERKIHAGQEGYK